MTLGTIENVIKRTVGNRVYFIGSLTSDQARKVTFVPVVEDSETYLDQRKEDGYQRPGKKTRMNQFKRHGLKRTKKN